jgi:hypothetical protein
MPGTVAQARIGGRRRPDDRELDVEREPDPEPELEEEDEPPVFERTRPSFPAAAFCGKASKQPPSNSRATLDGTLWRERLSGSRRVFGPEVRSSLITAIS